MWQWLSRKEKYKEREDVVSSRRHADPGMSWWNTCISFPFFIFFIPNIPSFFYPFCKFKLIHMPFLQLIEDLNLIDDELSWGLGVAFRTELLWILIYSCSFIVLQFIQMSHICVKNKTQSQGSLIRWLNPTLWLSVFTKLCCFDGYQNRWIS